MIGILTDEQDGDGARDGTRMGEGPVPARVLHIVRHKTLGEASVADKVKIANELAALVYGVTPDQLGARVRRERRLSEARQLGMYLANVCLCVGYEDIALEIDRDRTTVRYGIEKVEDRRENPDFDELLLAVETLIGCLLDKQLAGMIEKGLGINHDLIAYNPETD